MIKGFFTNLCAKIAGMELEFRIQPTEHRIKTFPPFNWLHKASSDTSFKHLLKFFELNKIIKN